MGVMDVNPYTGGGGGEGHRSDDGGGKSSNGFSYPYGYAPEQQHQSSLARRVPKKKPSWKLVLGGGDAESRRKRRVASYKYFSVEGRVRNSVRRSTRWIKIKWFNLRHGWW